MSKNYFSALFFLLLLAGLSACKKSSSSDYKCANCATSPTADAAYDHSSKGIYKGTIVGSTGTVNIEIENTGSILTAAIRLDDQWINMGTTTQWVAGQPFTATFSGVYGSQTATITFTVEADGSHPQVTYINIPGHTGATIVVYKELSSSQIKCYEGTYSGQSAGVFNMVVNTGADTWMAVVKGNNDNSCTLVSGTISGTSLTCSNCIGGTAGSSVSGTLSGDNMTGSWSDGQGGSGSWTSHRTM
ncbi:MAG: hypothetical protein JSS76_14525 [Bacteroidetes bacterium]|nr:hypothetical protein [Bacteroidota bacterium]MBS1685962.1 hypothetical protein [Bacteroidota bacterium]